MSDIIRLTGITAEGFHGVFDFEKREGQPFRVDAVLSLDLQPAGRSDRLEDTVSYASIAEVIEDSITGRPFDLIEALAESIAQRILLFDGRIETAEVTVHKPQAPLEQRFGDVAVTVERTRRQVGSTSNDTSTQPDPAGAGGPDQQGPYRRVSLTDLAIVYDEEGGERAGQQTAWVPADAPRERPEGLRDPDLAADFPVRSVLALGSNLPDAEYGSPAELLASAIRAVEEADGVDVVNSSPVARTKPVGGPEDQPDYLNQVIEVETTLSPHDLLNLTQRIEASHHRVRQEHWGPRTLDIDIITYAGAHISSARLAVPHPRADQRAFVLLPWSWMDPVALLEGVPVRQLAQQADDADHVEQL